MIIAVVPFLKTTVFQIRGFLKRHAIAMTPEAAISHDRVSGKHFI